MAQTTFRTETGEIQFDASTPMEDIYAVNRKVNFALTAEGEIAVLLLVKEFDFKRKLMQEHFNENYIESDKYPKAYLTGNLVNFNPEDISEEPITYALNGDLTLHGVTRPIDTELIINREGSFLVLQTEFTIKTEDHKIKVPRILFKKVAKEVRVRVLSRLMETKETE
ncbi:YceI family protein [Muriicola sp. SD30]|uniref:YceI family protein n=1 Tax=Muriicola sp. SD30 TaxID=3240936 RepID=UPI00350F0288